MLLGKPVHVFVPKSTHPSVVEMFQQYPGTLVTVTGEVWNDTNETALEFCAKVNGIFVHPFNQPTTWSGHSTMIDEVAEELKGVTPGAIVLSVGGGGLLLGTMQGMKRHGWDSVPIVAMETEGANCLALSLAAGKSVRLPTITSVAKTLGSVVVCPEVLKQKDNFNLISRVVSDEIALDACRKFARDHRYLTEPACGATLSFLYTDLHKCLDLHTEGPIVVIVCGGTSIELIYPED